MALNPQAVDHILQDGILFLEPEPLKPKGYKQPTSTEDMRRYVKRLVDSHRTLHRTTIHAACQSLAINIGRSYEWVREHYDAATD